MNNPFESNTEQNTFKIVEIDHNLENLKIEFLKVKEILA